MDSKFLSDGRKVAVVGQINSAQWIVQEIYVTGEGDEIPTGERFTTNSLHDAPVKSFKDKEAERLEQRIKERKGELDKIERQIKVKQLDAKVHNDINRFVDRATQGEMWTEDLETLTSFLTGEIRWLVADHYGFSEPVRFDEKMRDIDNWQGNMKHEGLKLLSLYGKTDGSLSYRLSQYRDGSGTSTEVWGFANYAEAARHSIALMLDRLDSGHGLNATEVAKLLKSPVVEHLTTDERTQLLQVITAAIEAARESHRKQAEDLHERNSKAVNALQSILSDA